MYCRICFKLILIYVDHQTGKLYPYPSNEGLLEILRGSLERVSKANIFQGKNEA